MAAAPGGIAPPVLQPRLGGFGDRDPLYPVQLSNQELFGAAPMPVVVFGAAEAEHILDDDVIAADLDFAVAGRAAVELAGDGADQPGLVALFGRATQAPAFVRQAVEAGHGAIAATASR